MVKKLPTVTVPSRKRDAPGGPEPTGVARLLDLAPLLSAQLSDEDWKAKDAFNAQLHGSAQFALLTASLETDKGMQSKRRWWLGERAESTPSNHLPRLRSGDPVLLLDLDDGRSAVLSADPHGHVWQWTRTGSGWNPAMPTDLLQLRVRASSERPPHILLDGDLRALMAGPRRERHRTALRRQVARTLGARAVVVLFMLLLVALLGIVLSSWKLNDFSLPAVVIGSMAALALILHLSAIHLSDLTSTLQASAPCPPLTPDERARLDNHLIQATRSPEWALREGGPLGVELREIAGDLLNRLGDDGDPDLRRELLGVLARRLDFDGPSPELDALALDQVQVLARRHAEDEAAERQRQADLTVRRLLDHAPTDRRF